MARGLADAWTDRRVWGGVQAFADYAQAFGACSNFDLYNTDLKAAMLCDYVSTPRLFRSLVSRNADGWYRPWQIRAGPVETVLVIAFYDGPTPPNPSPFANFSSIPTLTPGGWKTRTFLDLVKSAPADVLAGQRGWYHSASVRNVTPGIVTAIKAIGDKYSGPALLNSGVAININLGEPHLPPCLSGARVDLMGGHCRAVCVELLLLLQGRGVPSRPLQRAQAGRDQREPCLV